MGDTEFKMRMFTLNWDSYNIHIREMMDDLINDMDTADVTLVCDDGVKIRAHKLVLKACSLVFKTILHKNSTPNAFIYLRGINSAEMNLLLEYMYLGETTFEQENVENFLQVANDLKIKEINEIIQGLNNEPKEDLPSSCEKSQKAVEFNEMDTIGTSEDKYNIDDDIVEKKYLDYKPRIKNEKRKYACGKCEYKAKLKGNLTKHIQYKHEEGNEGFHCDQCDYIAKIKSHLKHHQKYKHEGVRYNCISCHYRATTTGSLKRHIKLIHETQRTQEIKHTLITANE